MARYFCEYIFANEGTSDYVIERTTIFLFTWKYYSFVYVEILFFCLHGNTIFLFTCDSLFWQMKESINGAYLRHSNAVKIPTQCSER